MSAEDDFKAEVRNQAKRLPKIRDNTIKEILRQLGQARATILQRLAATNLSAGGRRAFDQLKREVERAMHVFSTSATRAAHDGAEQAFAAGEDLITAPLRSAGFSAQSLGPRINTRALTAMQSFLTDRIKDISLQALDRMNTALGANVIGTATMSDTITAIQRILDGAPRARARTIAYTEIGRVYSMASYEAMQAKAKLVPGLAKRWLKSGKLHPRPEHVRAHNQIVRVDKPFMVDGEAMRFPRDPDASIENTINCGCQMVPVVSGSSFGASVLVVPADPNAPIRRVSPADRAADNARALEATKERLRQLGIVPTGVTIITSSNETRLIGDGDPTP